MSNLINKTKAMLESEHSSDELEAAYDEIKARVTEVVSRLHSIVATVKGTTWDRLLPASLLGAPCGAERRKAVDNGDVETLRKLDVEAEELAAEVEVLRSLQDRLRKCVDETKASEFVEAMPVAFTEFGKLLKAQAEAQEKARLARQAVDSKLSEIRGLREHVVLHGGSEVKRNQPSADPELLHQYMAVMGYTYHRGPNKVGWFSATGSPHDPQQLKDTAALLGVDVPRGQSIAA